MSAYTGPRGDVLDVFAARGDALAELRLAYNMWARTDTGKPALARLTAPQVLRLCESIRAGEWDVYPDQLTAWQVRDALRGKPPLFGEGVHDPQRYPRKPRPRPQYRAIFATKSTPPADYAEEPLTSGNLRDARREALAILRNKFPGCCGWYLRQIVRVA